MFNKETALLFRITKLKIIKEFFMAKSKPVSKKKPAVAARQTHATKKKTANAKKKPTSTKKKTSSVKKKTPTVKKIAPKSNNQPSNEEKHLALVAKHGTDAKKLLPSGAVDEYRVDLLPLPALGEIQSDIQKAMEDFQDIADNNLSPLQRRRKIGAGIRNYGFMEKVADLSEANPQFAMFFDPNDLRNAIMNFDECRNIALLLQSFIRLVTNTMLIYSNEGFIMASMYYNTVKEMSRRGDPTANALFRTLEPFFRRPKRPNTKTTMKQAEHDFEGLLKGTKEGSILIENIAPKITGGERKIVDNVRKGSLSVKEQENFKETE
jgi:hypothetical protein